MKPGSLAWAPASILLLEGTPEFSGEAGSDSVAADCPEHQHRSTQVSDLLLGCFPAVAEAGASTLQTNTGESCKPFSSHRQVNKSFTSLIILHLIKD